MTVLDPLAATERIAGRYRGYLESTFRPRRPDLRREFEAALRSDIQLTKGPFLQASPPFERGRSILDLVEEGVLSGGFQRLSEDAFPTARPLYLHQEQAIRKATLDDRNLVVATGTGSGKTECFLIPIIDHLLREQEAGTLDQPGVRALLLYPMNALANDQTKRLRQLLADLPEITFGRYVGDTKQTDEKAEEAFLNWFPGERRVPNELLSRDQMQATPPHILLTNYAMLEYLLLRPADSTLFDGPTGEHWRFVVLDEAHVYGGAQGTEVAMLLRRVRDRVVRSEPGRLQCFATSATLGGGSDDFPDLIDFAEGLFGETFAWEDGDPGRQDIVEATRLPLQQSDGDLELPQTVYGALQRCLRGGGDVAALRSTVETEAPAVTLPGELDTTSPEAFLYTLLRRDRSVVAVQAKLEEHSQDLRRLATEIFTGPSAAADLVALIDLCVAARCSDEDAPLIPARYHYFLRSLESAYLCLHPDHAATEPRLLLARHRQCPSCTRRGIDNTAFELGVCRNCRAEYLVGRVEHRSDGRAFDIAPEAAGAASYLLLGQPVDEDDEDQISVDIPGAERVEPVDLCPGCGRLLDAGEACGCPERPTAVSAHLVHLQKDEHLLRSCVACSARTSGEVVYRFLTGTDAPVAVVATDLYQEIPPSSDPRQAHQIGQGRKLLTFSDSRQDAAFFASFLDTTYGRAVERRLLTAAMDDLLAKDPDTAPQAPDVVERARKFAEAAMVLDEEKSPQTNRAAVGYWLMHELLAFDRRQSMEGTGIAEISVILPRRYIPPPIPGLEPDEVTDLIQLLFETLRANGAVTAPDDVELRSERFAPRNFDIGARGRGADKAVVAWLPAAGARNRRLEIVQKVFERKHIDADPLEVLDRLWTWLTDANDIWAKTLIGHNDKRKGPLWRLSWERFQLSPSSEAHRPMRCNLCHRLWWRTVAGICPGWRCTGTVDEPVDADSIQSDHYARLYRSIEPIAMEVQEHTAQWKSDHASRLQQEFISGRLNVLSCSTTFELGVDVGEVQSVLLRNMPPSPANYVQRAGRAGRRADSAALVITFAQRRSHDLSHFFNPSSMVDGTVAPPVILLENSSIARRHVHSVAFAAFERHCADTQGEQHRSVADFFLGDGEVPADQRWLAWLRSRPAALGDALARLLPGDLVKELGVHDWSWVDALAEPSDEDLTFGWLGRAADRFRAEHEMVGQLYADAMAADNPGLAKKYQFLRQTLEGENLLGFLATKNVLPKYGFPVDVVELALRNTSDEDATHLDLTRDLKLAITDYAPGAEVVAAKARWRSIGLGVRPDQAWKSYHWAVCSDCGAYRQDLGELPACEVCGATAKAPGKSGTYVIPLFGFLGKRAGGAGETRPVRRALTETFFGAYGEELLPLASVEGLDGVPVEARTSKQGRINVVNRGPAGRGFRLCEWCGHGEPAPEATTRKKSAQPEHDDPRWPDRKCRGTLVHRHLGHEYLTDALEIRIHRPMDLAVARSVLYALIEGAASLSVARDDIDGTLWSQGPGTNPAFVIFDTVPGGAGHARRLHDALPDLFRAALGVVATCECGEETSCYTCLRSYSNQLFHDELSRGAARDVLEEVLGYRMGGAAPFSLGDVERDLALAHDAVRPLVRAAIEAGVPPPVFGYEAGDGSVVEAAWPDAKAAVVLSVEDDCVPWLVADGWDVRAVDDWTLSALVDALN